MRWRIVGAVAASCVLAGVLMAPQVSSAALPSVTRLSGSDRYATSAAISAASFGPGVPVAYIATGTTYPDALTGGPAGAKLGGPVLLVTASAIPDSVATELHRLNPQRIVILGGTNTVSSSVQGGLAQFTAGTVTRIAGSDRYDTAAQISAAVFTGGAPVAYVATGESFPDALAGAAAAAAQGGPVLLTTGGSLPAVTGTELGRLKPSTIVVLGGTSSVSQAVQSQLGGYSSNVVREGGADRFGTAVAVSGYAFASGAPRVFLATGADFPDAISGGPAAGVAKAPVLLTTASCIPPSVSSEVSRLAPGATTILGGEASVSASVAGGQVCVPPPAAPFTFGDGTFRIPAQLPAGTYRTRTDSSGCYWKRLKNFSGSDDILANEFTDFHSVVTVLASDPGFETSDCARWTNDLSPITSSGVAPFGSGTWIVNTDISSGTWTAPGGSDCYWKRMSNFTGTDDILANDFDTTNPVVTISSSDAGFKTEDCGTWTRVS